MQKIFLFFLFVLCSCANQNRWELDAIAGNQTFDSSRIRYSNPQNPSPLAFELIRIGDRIEAFLNLSRYRLSPSPEDPSSVKTILSIEGERYEESVPLLEGRMRIRLSNETAERIILALQDGKKVSILIDDFEETLEPNEFSRTYNKFLGNQLLGNGFRLENLFKGPLR